MNAIEPIDLLNDFPEGMMQIADNEWSEFDEVEVEAAITALDQAHEEEAFGSREEMVTFLLEEDFAPGAAAEALRRKGIDTWVAEGQAQNIQVQILTDTGWVDAVKIDREFPVVVFTGEDGGQYLVPWQNIGGE